MFVLRSDLTNTSVFVSEACKLTNIFDQYGSLHFGWGGPFKVTVVYITALPLLLAVTTKYGTELIVRNEHLSMCCWCSRKVNKTH